MNQRDQQSIAKREIDRVIDRLVDELDLSFASLIGVLELVKAEIVESCISEIIESDEKNK